MKRGTAVLRYCGTAVLGLLWATPVGAQLRPNGDWRTIPSTHFRVHFQPATETVARRAVIEAERAYNALARELKTPRGTIDLVISDDVDYTNGYATPLPTNRIVVYAHPPVDVASLRFYDDWLPLVITHELTHIFHLDRARGLWAFGQHIFGRNPSLFPNLYAPSWFTEGLAVYYESRITGAGRIAGTEHRALARAGLAERGGIERINELSLGSSHYPYGNLAYAYGSLLVDYVARTRGDSTIRSFVERTSVVPVPFFYNTIARGTFGETWERAWRDWRDSLSRTLGQPRAPLTGWRELPGGGRDIDDPEWLASNRLLYFANTGRDVPGSYVTSVGASSRPSRRTRRNSAGGETVRADGSVIFAQLDYLDPYTLRSDLWVEDREGRQRRLTRGARLSSPSVSRDGSQLVAVRSYPATTTLSLLRLQGDSVIDSRDIAPASLEANWSEPRFSPDGSRIVASRWRRGGLWGIVVLDGPSFTPRVLFEGRAVNAAPAWSADGRWIYFTSDRSGATQLYRVRPDGSGRAERLSDAQVSVSQPRPSPDGGELAMLQLRADGYHIGVAPDIADAAIRPDTGRTGESRLQPPASATVASQRYSPWRGLIPRYWVPLLSTAASGSTAIGAFTSASDVLERHAYSVEAYHDLGRHDWTGNASYTYLGFGLPIVSLSTGITRSYGLVRDSAATSGELRERSVFGTAALTFTRPRIRNFASLSVGGSYEVDAYETSPDTLLRHIPAFFSSTPSYPRAFASVSWSNTRRPSLSISPEDGIAVSLTGDQRWVREDRRFQTRSLVGAARAYRSLDLPGFSHHVVAMRGSFGVSDSRAVNLFEVGGRNGSSVEVIPGYTVGGSRRTFPVRGFVPGTGTLRGTHALSASTEYRLPLAAPSRGLGSLPLFVDRTSVALFADAGAAWCSALLDANGSCRNSWQRPTWINAFGAELNIDAALQYDLLYRLRLGVAVPGRSLGLVSGPSIYVDFGLSF